MSTLLINTSRHRPTVAPLGLEYVCSSLAQAGLDFRLVDLNFEPATAIDRALKDPSLELVGLNIRNIDTAYLVKNRFFLPDVRDLISRIKNARDVPVVVGGAGFSVMPREILKFVGADFGVVGYGEEALPLLIGALRAGGRNCGAIPNLAWRNGSEVQVNALSKEGYATVPRRRRDLLRNREYFQRCGMGNIETKRGCFMRCGYCNEPNIVGRQVAMRSNANVLDELQSLRSQGIHHVHFCDSEFNVGKQGDLIQFCEDIANARLGLTWTAFVHPNRNLLPVELVRAMKAAGCVEITAVVDSGDDALLRSMDKLHTAEDVIESSTRFRDAGIRVVHSYLIGWPGESEATLGATVELMRRCRADVNLVFTGIRIYPRTKLAEMALLEGAIRADTDLLLPIFYHPEAAVREFLPFLRSHTRGISNCVLPTRGVDFVNLLMQNIYQEGFGGSFSDFADHMAKMSVGTKLRLAGRTAVEWFGSRS